MLYARWFTKHILSLGYLESHSEESNTFDNRVTESMGLSGRTTKRADEEKNKVRSAAFFNVNGRTFIIQQALDGAQSS